MKRYGIYGIVCLCMVSIGYLHKPKTEKTCVSAQAYAKAECVIEAKSRRVLYASNADTRLPMASTTKIVTAITVLEHVRDLQEEIEIPAQATGIEGSSVYLKEGDKYTVEDLLFGLMLRSGNDCATALALKTGQSVERFSSMMNLTAQKAGAFASSFRNPHGLPCKNHYTTAQDLSLITAYAMQNATFRKIVATKYYEPRHWKNKNKMLTLINDAVGVKTGYTKEAGRCLVSAVEREGMTLICTVLGCPQTYERSISLLQDVSKTYRYVKVLDKSTPVCVGNVQGVPAEDFYYPLSEGEEAHIEIKIIPTINKKSKKTVGQFQIYLTKRLIFSGNLYKL